MYLIDYHVHTVFSRDSETKPEDAVLAAISRGIKEIAITDHVEIDYPPVFYFDPADDFDHNDYDAELSRLKQKYANKIRVVTGVEMGLQPHAKANTDKYLLNKQLDFIIGSTHAVSHMDLWAGDFFDGKTKREAYTEYLLDVYESVTAYDFFHVYGHLDAVVRYGDYANKTLSYADYAEIIDAILKLLIEKGKGIELNSSGFRYGLKAPHPTLEILKRYKALGGEIITAGSDAHKANDVGKDLDKIYDYLKSAGFKAITTFVSGNPVFNDI